MRYRLLTETSLRTLRAGLVLAGMSAAVPAWALPQGGTVSGGSAQITGDGGVLQVNQGTDRAVIDWQSFNIAASEIAKFNQPSASSAILNRIHDKDPSQIMGNLSANGIVALVNPNGMVFGRGSRIGVGSLIATTVDISNERFMNGQNLLFGQPGEKDAAVVNRGSIKVREGGLAALVAPYVSNEGVIHAKAGRVALGAGEVFTVDLYGDGLISLAASDRLDEVAVKQSGGIRAEGGTVVLTTAEAKGVMDQAVNMDGWVDVSGLTADAGSIVLHAAEGTASVNGKLHADGAVGTGGKLQVTGEHVKMGADAVLTALGTYGGGDIKIGGDYLGGGTTPRTRTTHIADGASIDAGATASGKGGRVIVWSDERTDFGGMIYAKGGLSGGDGGFVETSSKEILSVHGLVDASAPNGKGGEWLLDPNNVTINATADANVAGAPTYTTTDDNAVVTVASIQAALNAGTSVSITTGAAGANTQTGSITVSNAISKTAGGDASLTLKAHGNIDVNADISSNSGELDLTLWADSDSSGSGYVRLTNAAITTSGGDVVIGGGIDPMANPAMGNATVDDGVTLNNGDISTGVGNISIRGQGEAAGASNMGVTILAGSVFQTTTGNISLFGTGGAGTSSNSGIHMTGAGTEITSVDGDILLNGTAGNGSASGNRGVLMDTGPGIRSTGVGGGAGTITIIGAGRGISTGYGVDIRNAGSFVTSAYGDIDITGTTTATGTNNDGVLITNTPVISSTGIGADAADIRIDGTGSGNSNTNNDGTNLSFAEVTTVDGDITITGEGGGNATNSTNLGINMNFGAVVESTGTGAGAGEITFEGTGGTGVSHNYGIFLTDAGSLITSVDGDIWLTGNGRGTGLRNYGINIETGGKITSTGTGLNAATIDLEAIAPNGSQNNHGMRLSGAGVEITSVEGNIDISGQAGSVGDGNVGMLMELDADISSTGIGANAATVTLSGTGGNGASINYGMVIEDSGTSVTSVDGDINIIGDGGDGSTNDNYGLWLHNDADVRSTGTGVNAATIMITGTGGNGTTNNYGVIIADAGTTLTSADGAVSVIGVGAPGASSTNNDGIRVESDADILSTGAADITLTGTAGANGSSEDIQTLTGTVEIGGGAATGDITLNMNTQNLANLSVQTAGNIVLQPRTAGATVGVTGGAGTLDLSAAVLAFMNWGDTLILGRSDGTGGMAVGARNWGGENAHLRSGAGAISINGAQTNLDDFTLTTNADPTIAAGVTGTGTLTLQPVSAATTMGLAGAAGTVNLSAADLTNLGSGWTNWLVGATMGTGTITIGARSWADPVTFRSAAGGSIVISGAQTATAASDVTFTFTSPATVNAALDLTNATGGTQAITFNDTAAVSADITSGGGDVAFNDPLSLGADISTGGGNITLVDDVTLTAASSIDTVTADIVFAGTLDGAQDFEVTTTGDITFNDDVGGTTRLGDVMLDPRHTVASGVFNAASLTLVNGTGNVNFIGGLNTTGDINIDTNGNIQGIYEGTNGALDAGAGNLNATVSFLTLDISGVSANLLAGYIGMPGTANQAMANRIKIDGVGHPFLPGYPTYRFAGFIIGAFTGGGGGNGDTPLDPTPPIVTPPPVSPVPPVVSNPEATPGELPALTLYSFPYASTERLYSALGSKRRFAASFMRDTGPRVWLQGYEPSKNCDENSIVYCEKNSHSN